MSPTAPTLRAAPPATLAKEGALAPAAFAPQETAPARTDGPPPAAEAPARGKPRIRRLVLLLVALALLGGGAWFGERWWTEGRFVESTDDAYVKADIIGVAAQVAGTVTTVPIIDNQHVEAGDVLVEIDPRDYEAAVATAKASIAAAKAAIADVDARKTLAERAIDVAAANLESAEASLTFDETDYQRNVTLQKRGTVPERTLQESKTNLVAAKATVDRMKATLASEKQQLVVLAAERSQREADLQSAEAQLATASLDLERTTIRAARSGTIGNRGVEAGEYVHVGSQLLSLVPDEHYVVANFKETQIRNMRPGMPVEVEVDMLGGQALEGHVDSLAPAAGAEFAILPPQNATGNFTKIVQRVPIKVAIDEHPGDTLPLRPGTSVVVSVDTRGESERQVAGAAAAAETPRAPLAHKAAR